MQDLKRVQYVTANFSSLQGLKLVPWGLLFLVLAAQDGGWAWLVGRQGDCTITLPLFLVVVALYIAIGRYYDHTFGRVRPARSGVGDLAMAVFMAALIGAIAAEMTWKLPVSLIGLVMAAGFAGTGWLSRRWHFVVLGALTAGASLLPLWLNVPISDPYFGSLGFTLKLILGLAYVAGGLFDHYLLLRALRPPADEGVAL